MFRVPIQVWKSLIRLINWTQTKSVEQPGSNMHFILRHHSMSVPFLCVWTLSSSLCGLLTLQDNKNIWYTLPSFFSAPGEIPECWLDSAYPTMEDLDGFLEDLMKRTTFLRSWQKVVFFCRHCMLERSLHGFALAAGRPAGDLLAGGAVRARRLPHRHPLHPQPGRRGALPRADPGES